MAVGSVKKDVGSQRHHAFMVCYARVWIGTPTVQFCAAMWLYSSLTKSNSYTINKVLHDDMQLNTQPMIADQPIFFLPWMV